MVRGKLKLDSRASASSILEVVVSMVLILIVFTIAMMISANVLRSSLSLKKINAQAVLYTMLIKAEQSAKVESESFTIDDLVVVQEVKPYDGQPGLTQIYIAAYDGNKQLITEVKKILIINND